MRLSVLVNCIFDNEKLPARQCMLDGRGSAAVIRSKSQNT